MKPVNAEEEAVLKGEKAIVLHQKSHIVYWRDTCKTWEKETNMGSEDLHRQDQTDNKLDGRPLTWNFF
jgi:hypothetical protein